MYVVFIDEIYSTINSIILHRSCMALTQICSPIVKTSGHTYVVFEALYESNVTFLIYFHISCPRIGSKQKHNVKRLTGIGR